MKTVVFGNQKLNRKPYNNNYTCRSTCNKLHIVQCFVKNQNSSFRQIITYFFQHNADTWQWFWSIVRLTNYERQFEKWSTKIHTSENRRGGCLSTIRSLHCCCYLLSERNVLLFTHWHRWSQGYLLTARYVAIGLHHGMCTMQYDSSKIDVVLQR